MNTTYSKIWNFSPNKCCGMTEEKNKVSKELVFKDKMNSLKKMSGFF